MDTPRYSKVKVFMSVVKAAQLGHNCLFTLLLYVLMGFHSIMLHYHYHEPGTECTKIVLSVLGDNIPNYMNTI
jgi:hypothetical protein